MEIFAFARKILAQILGVLYSFSMDFLFTSPPDQNQLPVQIAFDFGSLVNVSWKTDFTFYSIHLGQYLTTQDGSSNHDFILYSL